MKRFTLFEIRETIYIHSKNVTMEKRREPLKTSNCKRKLYVHSLNRNRLSRKRNLEQEKCRDVF